ncbi:hypothetical protein MMC14_010407 [Varicellaria rhodocarpa]|nr:hypothetical protein [Varicellaria rhodocarpa]
MVTQFVWASESVQPLFVTVSARTAVLWRAMLFFQMATTVPDARESFVAARVGAHETVTIHDCFSRGWDDAEAVVEGTLVSKLSRGLIYYRVTGAAFHLRSTSRDQREFVQSIEFLITDNAWVFSTGKRKLIDSLDCMRSGVIPKAMEVIIRSTKLEVVSRQRSGSWHASEEIIIEMFKVNVTSGG